MRKPLTMAYRKGQPLSDLVVFLNLGEAKSLTSFILERQEIILMCANTNTKYALRSLLNGLQRGKMGFVCLLYLVDTPIYYQTNKDLNVFVDLFFQWLWLYNHGVI